MEAKILELPLLKVVGLEMLTTANAQAETDVLWAEADRLRLGERIANRTEPAETLVFISDWNETEPFTYLLAAAVSELGEHPDECVYREFPAATYAVFEMPGVMPNLTEPWPDIQAWFKHSDRRWQEPMTFRRFDDTSGRGELCIPLA